MRSLRSQQPSSLHQRSHSDCHRILCFSARWTETVSEVRPQNCCSVEFDDFLLLFDELYEAWKRECIAQLLHHCGRYPEPKSVIVMDNASWHHSEKILQMCQDAEVVLEFLSPYSK